MSHIIPIIKNGSRQLLISEAFLCTRDDDVTINFPMNNKQPIFNGFSLKFLFEDNKDSSISAKHTIEGKELCFTLYNDKDGINKISTDWFVFNIGEDALQMLLSLKQMHENFVKFHISIYLNER